MKRVLITGSTGYIGSALVKRLSQESQYELILPVRRIDDSLRDSGEQVIIRDIQDLPSSIFTKVEVVVHLAGKAHDLSRSRDLVNKFRRVNVDATTGLAAAARSAGVKKFIFLSSVGVCGNTTLDIAFTEDSFPHPSTAYATSKLDAENAISEIANGSSMGLVLIRPPLVYSATAPGNFGRLLRLVSLGLPLPFRHTGNSRSIIALENLVDFIRLCIEHPSSGGNVFLISDGEDVSTEDIIRYVAQGMERRVFLFPFPHEILRVLASSLGKRQLYTQLFGSLVIDSAKARKTLSWVPPLAAIDALVRAGQEYSHANSSRK